MGPGRLKGQGDPCNRGDPGSPVKEITDSPRAVGKRSVVVDWLLSTVNFPKKVAPRQKKTALTAQGSMIVQ